VVRVLRSLTAFLALCVAIVPALAQEQVKIGVGSGFAFLPLYICEDLKLIEKRAKLAHLDVQARFQRFANSGEVHDAIAKGQIDMGPFGTAPLIAAWQQTKGTPGEILAVSGITSLPLALLGNQASEHSIAELKPTDHIAVPTPTSPQIYLLEMQSEKTFGRFDRLLGQIVVLSHQQSIAALVENTGQATAYFSSPPFTQLALRSANVHVLLSSSDVVNGKSSFLILAARRSYLDAHPQMAQVVERAIDEAARIIHDDPRRAAQIYLTHEPSVAFNGAAIETVVRDVKDEFGSPVYGVQAFADFMNRRGDLETPLQSWKEIVAPAMLNSPST
jgi:NitT/TauT family transport system substrate-binding protein